MFFAGNVATCQDASGVHKAYAAFDLDGYTTDANGYSVPETYASPVDRLVFGWQPEQVDVRVDVQYQMRVTDRQQVMVPDISVSGPNDQVALGVSVAAVDANPVWRRVDQIQDVSHDPFGITAFGAAPGALILEAVSG